MRHGTWWKSGSFAYRAFVGVAQATQPLGVHPPIRSGSVRAWACERSPGRPRTWGVELRVTQPWAGGPNAGSHSRRSGPHRRYSVASRVPSSRTLEAYTRFLLAVRGLAAFAELGERWRQPCDRIWPSSWIRAALIKIWRASEYFPGAWEVESKARDLFSLDWRRLSDVRLGAGLMTKGAGLRSVV